MIRDLGRTEEVGRGGVRAARRLRRLTMGTTTTTVTPASQWACRDMALS
jgi:hypothetical protein